MKSDTTFVRMRSGDYLGDAKMSKKAPRFVEFNFLTNCNRRKWFCRRKEEGKIYKICLTLLNFCLGSKL